MMMAFLSRLSRLRRDNRGAAAVETALVAPVLILMSVGAYQTSRMVVRQQELSNGADEAAAMVLAGYSDSTAQRTALARVISSSLGLADNKVTVTAKYRCATATAYVDDNTTCGPSDIVATFLRIQITDQYRPVWNQIGVTHNINFSVNRMVQIS